MSDVLTSTGLAVGFNECRARWADFEGLTVAAQGMLAGSMATHPEHLVGFPTARLAAKDLVELHHAWGVER